MIPHTFSPTPIPATVRPALSAILGLGMLPLLAPLSAGTWDGGGANAHWATGQNWVGDVAPGTTEPLDFGSGFASGHTIYLKGSRVAHSLSFNSGLAPSLTFNGDSGLAQFPPGWLTLASGTLTAAYYAGNIVFDCDVYLSVRGHWTVADHASVTVLRTLSGGEQTGFLKGGFLKDGDGEVIFQGTGTYVPLTTVGAGVLTVASSSALPTNGSVVVGRLGTGSTSGTLFIKSQVQASLSNLMVQNEGVVDGDYSAYGVAVANLYLKDSAAVKTAVRGQNTLVSVQSGAKVKLLNGFNDFIGKTQVAENGRLTIQGVACLGKAGNAIELANNAELEVLNSNGAVDTTTRVVIPSATAAPNLFVRKSFGMKLEGPGTADFQPYQNTTLALTGANPNFSGRILRSVDNLVAKASGCLGNATEIRMGSGARLVLDAANPASATPILRIASGGGLNPQNHTEQFGTLIVESGTCVLELSDDGSPCTTTFSGASFPYAGGKVEIKGWNGVVGGSASSTGDKVVVTQMLSPSALSRIKFNVGGQLKAALQKPDGQLARAE